MNVPFFIPADEFDHPIDVLDGCHERIRRFCATIERLASHVAGAGADTEARVAAAAVVHFFDTAGSSHHRDEEEDLFPALKQHASLREQPALLALLTRLRADHRKLDSLWKDMRWRLATIVEGRAGDLTPAVARAFTAAYERHIEVEESQMLPLARRILAPDLQHELGVAMARRRGVTRRPPAGSD